jgi:phenylpyruvate tautomerase PptA (4-oxalocrotonate tautomerase family)
MFMPMIDVFAAKEIFPEGSERELGEALTFALLRAEGVAEPSPTHLNNTGVYLHRMLPSEVQTAGSAEAITVRVQVVTPPAVLSRDGQKQLVGEATEIVTRISGDPSQATRTWVLLTEAAEGGWGIGGTAFGKEEFAALAAKAAANK